MPVTHTNSIILHGHGQLPPLYCNCYNVWSSPAQGVQGSQGPPGEVGPPGPPVSSLQTQPLHVLPVQLTLGIISTLLFKCIKMLYSVVLEKLAVLPYVFYTMCGQFPGPTELDSDWSLCPPNFP